MRGTNARLIQRRLNIYIIFTTGLWWLVRVSSAEDGGGGSLEREEPKPAPRFLFAAVPVSCHPLLLHFPLHLLKKVRHLHLFVVPESMTLHHRHTQNNPHLSNWRFKTNVKVPLWWVWTHGATQQGPISRCRPPTLRIDRWKKRASSWMRSKRT